MQSREYYKSDAKLLVMYNTFENFNIKNVTTVVGHNSHTQFNVIAEEYGSLSFAR